MNTTYFKNLVMGNLFKTKTSPAIPTKYYIGLSRSEPNVSGGNVGEPPTSGTGYTRMELSNLSTPSGGTITNTTDIRFPESQTDWFEKNSPATHYVIYDAQTGGNLLMYNELTKSRIIESNTVATIRAGSLQMKLLD